MQERVRQVLTQAPPPANCGNVQHFREHRFPVLKFINTRYLSTQSRTMSRAIVLGTPLRKTHYTETGGLDWLLRGVVHWPEHHLESYGHVILRSRTNEWKVPAFILNRRRNLKIPFHEPVHRGRDVGQTAPTKKYGIIPLSAIPHLNLVLRRKPIGAPCLNGITLASHPATDNLPVVRIPLRVTLFW